MFAWPDRQNKDWYCISHILCEIVWNWPSCERWTSLKRMKQGFFLFRTIQKFSKLFFEKECYQTAGFSEFFQWNLYHTHTHTCFRSVTPTGSQEVHRNFDPPCMCGLDEQKTLGYLIPVCVYFIWCMSFSDSGYWCVSKYQPKIEQKFPKSILIFCFFTIDPWDTEHFLRSTKSLQNSYKIQHRTECITQNKQP